MQVRFALTVGLDGRTDPAPLDGWYVECEHCSWDASVGPELEVRECLEKMVIDHARVCPNRT